MLDNRLEGFSKNLEASQKALPDTQMAKIDETLSDNYRFKKTGNEGQHKHNNKVMVKLREGLSTENLDSAKVKISEGLKIDQHVHKAVLESGVTADSPLNKLCPKIAGYYWRAKVTILQNHIFTDLGGGNNLLRNRVILLCQLNRFTLLCI